MSRRALHQMYAEPIANTHQDALSIVVAIKRDALAVGPYLMVTQ